MQAQPNWLFFFTSVSVHFSSSLHSVGLASRWSVTVWSTNTVHTFFLYKYQFVHGKRCVYFCAHGVSFLKKSTNDPNSYHEYVYL